MAEVDVIIPSNSINKELIDMAQACIDSLIESEDEIKFNILVFEQQPDVYYKNAETVHYSYPFKYNRIMNHGISLTKSDYICMANNDLLFRRGWCTELLRWSDKYMSMSPRCPVAQKNMTRHEFYEGYRIAHELSGWCIFCNRKLFDIIGALDESRVFWFSDNVYADALQAHGIKHALISKSIVRHLISKTTEHIGLDKMIKHVAKREKDEKDNLHLLDGQQSDVGRQEEGV